jgi:sugar phosphate isomerase/epimerase
MLLPAVHFVPPPDLTRGVIDMSEPRFAVSEFSTMPLSYEEDLAAYAAGGAAGIGIAEAKLPEGQDRESLARLRESGLKATICLPAGLSVLPLPAFPGPDDPEERIASLCASVRRFAPFEPETMLCLTGPVGDRDPQEARRIVIEGLRAVARAGEEAGVRVALEPIHASARDDFTIVDNIPDAVSLLDEAGVPSMGILFDTWHLWDTPNVLDHIREQAHRFPAVHVNDWRDPTRGWDDRALPGDGIMGLPAMFGALDAAGFDGWYELEIFSTETYPDSLLKLDPAEMVRRGKAGFLQAWNLRH